MHQITCNVAIIGGGPAGLAAAAAALREGAEKVLILERDNALGGILQQCIHPGFGLTRFGQELTGPEYYSRFTSEVEELGVDVLLDTMVLEVNHEEKTVTCVNSRLGLTQVKAGAIVLAMGCRERTRAAICVPGTRPSGLYTAGSAQRLINRQNIMVGKEVVILGSGDIGMIMARRMTLEGAKVKMVVELADYLAGLTRNRVQCLDDFGIELKLSHTITRIVGEQRVTGVYIAPVDEKKQPITEKEFFVECDTVLFSVGLLPENELTRKAGIAINPITNGPAVNQYMQTSAEAVFACGNVVHVNDLVDNVSAESERAGMYAAKYAMGTLPTGGKTVSCVTGRNVRYLCPQQLHITEEGGEATLYFRVLQPELNVRLVATCDGKVLAKKKEFRVNPGEMCNLKVNTAEVCGDVTVDVVKED
jgi:NADPH-dependent 2,4-dienoyl-CoA reductase/sulfur reductase-like enzyme